MRAIQILVLTNLLILGCSPDLVRSAGSLRVDFEHIPETTETIELIIRLEEQSLLRNVTLSNPNSAKRIFIESIPVGIAAVTATAMGQGNLLEITEDLVQIYPNSISEVRLDFETNNLSSDGGTNTSTDVEHDASIADTGPTNFDGGQEMLTYQSQPITMSFSDINKNSIGGGQISIQEALNINDYRAFLNAASAKFSMLSQQITVSSVELRFLNSSVGVGSIDELWTNVSVSILDTQSNMMLNIASALVPAQTKMLMISPSSDQSQLQELLSSLQVGEFELGISGPSPQTMSSANFSGDIELVMSFVAKNY